MIETLGQPFVLRALAATVLVGVAAPVVGSFTVQRGQSLIGDGIGHVAFAGVGFALLLGLTPLWGALALAACAALLLHVLQRQGLAGDVALAVVFYSGIAAGYLLASRAGAAGAGLLAILFGSPLTLRWSEVGVVAALSLGALGTVAVFHRPLVALAFEPEAARVSGVPVDRLTLTLTVLAALVVVGGMASVGILLVGALMVVPVATGARLARSYRGTLWWSASAGALSAAGGLVAAVALDAAPGASVVVVAVLLYGAVAALARQR